MLFPLLVVVARFVGLVGPVINALPEDRRGGRSWHYALVGEALFHDWRQRGARLAGLLDFARLRSSAALTQGQLDLM